MKKIAVFVVLTATLAACQPTVVSEFEDLPVVESFLLNDEPVSIKISKLIPFRDNVSYSPENVDNLAITITDETENKDYALTLRDSGVYVGGNNFLPAAEHTYSLHFTYNGNEISAETQIAAMPQNVVLSKEEVIAQTMGNFQPGSGEIPEFTNDSLVVSWDNPDRDYYFVIVENIEDDPEAINSGFGGMGGMGGGNGSLLFRTELSQDASVNIQAQQFGYYGRYLVHVCRLQPEYVTLLQHSSETLVEVFANVVGGFGVFTGISRHSEEIRVIESEE